MNAAQLLKNETYNGIRESPNGIGRSLAIHPIEASHVDQLNKLSVSSRTKDFEILWIKSGRGSIILDSDTYMVTDNVIFCIAPGQLRQLKMDSAVHGYYISLSPDFLCLPESQMDFSFIVTQHSRGNNMIVINPGPEVLLEMESIMTNMIKEFQKYRQLQTEILKGFLKVFLIYLLRELSGSEIKATHSRDQEIVTKFLELVRRNFTNMKKVSDYASELCVTPNYLNQIIKKISGYPASYHIQQQIVSEAKRQALYSGLRLKEIADFLGFSDYAHFSKFFKTYSGVSFSDFKKKLQLHKSYLPVRYTWLSCIHQLSCAPLSNNFISKSKNENYSVYENNFKKYRYADPGHCCDCIC